MTTAVTPPFRSVPPERVQTLQRAAELGVGDEEIVLRSDDEIDLWHELVVEFDLLVERLGPVWVAD